MVIIGITGGIATGKNLISEYLKKRKINIFDADEEVHSLLAKSETDLYSKITRLFPECVIKGKINRDILGKIVFPNSKKLKQLENIIYPELTKELDKFLKKSKEVGEKIVIINAPTLYKAKWDKKCGYIIFLYAKEEVTKERYLERGDREIERFENIKKNQMAMEKNKKRADFMVNTARSKTAVIQEIDEIINSILENEK